MPEPHIVRRAFRLLWSVSLLPPHDISLGSACMPCTCTTFKRSNPQHMSRARLFFVIGLLVASVFPPITFMLTWSKVPAVRPYTPPGRLALALDSKNAVLPL